MILNGRTIGNIFPPLENAAAFLTELYKQMGISYAKFHKMDALCKLGFLATELCLTESGNFLERHPLSETGIILANAASSLDTDEHYQASIRDKSAYFPSPAVFVYTLPNIVTGEMAIRHKITGENAFFVTEQFEAETLVEYTDLLFQQGLVSSAIAGWVNVYGNALDALIYLVERPDDSIKNSNFNPHNSSSLNHLYHS